ncbi:unannotated protein [freshwater metagenome]|uniref:Unannotated protein n=1 Tax=freshwater metagenome TaxID=449393 RepID=A0A6J7S3J5_9ZZZZ
MNKLNGVSARYISHELATDLGNPRLKASNDLSLKGLREWPPVLVMHGRIHGKQHHPHHLKTRRIKVLEYNSTLTR